MNSSRHFVNRSPSHMPFMRAAFSIGGNFTVLLVFLSLIGVSRAVEGGAYPSDIPSEKQPSELRMVWVLQSDYSSSELGPVSSEIISIVTYEIRCADGQLLSAHRSISSLGRYGSHSWVVRIDRPLSVPDGARALQGALEKICKESRASSS